MKRYSSAPLLGLLCGFLATILSSGMSPARASDFTWSTKSPNTFGSSDVGASAVALDRLYLFGYQAAGSLLSGVFYTPAADSWNRAADSIIPVQDGGAAAIGDKIYVISGWAAYDPYIQTYDATQNTWTVGPIRPGAGRLGGVSLAAVNGLIYAIGGDGSNHVDIYSPTLNAWYTPGTAMPMPTARGYASVAVLGNEIYVIGGIGAGEWLTTVEAYNTQTNTWSTKAPLYFGRQSAKAVSLHQKIFLIGGREDHGSGTVNTVLEYNPVQNLWHLDRRTISLDRAAFGAGVIQDTTYVAGGVSDTRGYLSSIEQGKPVKLFISLVRGYSFWSGGTGCGSDGLDLLLQRINMTFGEAAIGQIFCSYYTTPSAPNRQPAEFLINHMPDPATERAVLIGHSHGGYWAWKLTRTGKFPEFGVYLNALITIDPIDWNLCRGEGTPFCGQGDQSTWFKAAQPGIPFMNYVQRHLQDRCFLDLWGFNIGTYADVCDNTVLAHLNNRTCTVGGYFMCHTEIDNSNKVHAAILSILNDLMNS